MTKKKGQNISLKPVTISHITAISRDAYVLSFPRSLEFQAGQVIAIGLNEEDDPRVYSIASGCDDPMIDILFNIKPEGHLTPSLARMKAGDTIWISQAFGSFLGNTGPACWIAAGTGIAPFRSMLRSGQFMDKTMIHGGRYLDSFYFSSEFSAVLGEKFVRCCSQEIAKDTYHGRVTAYLESMTDLPEDMSYYLCGSAEMVIECREILLLKGIAFMNIHSEVYF